ncbi:leucyl aminopeptidase [Candidatus Scalindua japonica]|uniref:Leucyl aminopeptidase n=2 Tax=Candidatus Scalindua japonica TaxID=1284222 RepID=A0A286TVR7_9BACT|nr:leucyl aminopeptidase [Candidatus Scalindua japonica]
MSDSNKQKQEFCLSAKETATKLRTLANELESGVVAIGRDKFSIADNTEVKISLKAKGDTFSSKLKFKIINSLSSIEEDARKADNNGESTSSTESGVEGYKDLKKRMSLDFKAIKKSCIQEQTLPELDMVERFYQDSKKMCSYPDKGEEFYETFLKQASYFYEAYKSSDSKAMISAIESLAQIRSDCHKKHK